MLAKTRIAVFVSGGGTNLQALIDAVASEKIKNGEIVCVVSSAKDAFAIKRAEKAGIPTVTVSKKECKTREEFENGLFAAVKLYDAELIVLAGFMCILSAEFVSLFERRIINVHPSLIPSFCGEGFYGLKVHEAALARGVKLTGATVHFVNEIPDGGEIIKQKSVIVHKNDTPKTLQNRVMREAEWKILPRAVEDVSLEIRREKDEHLR